MRKNFIFIGFAILIVCLAAILNSPDKRIQESITYFPIDPKISFREANTTISRFSKAANNKYTFFWELSSILDRKAYLRQDVGLLFSNGRLTSTLVGWKPNTDKLKQEKRIIAEKNGFIQVFAFHYAEVHENDHIFSAQKLSVDRMYVINPPDNKLRLFRRPSSKEEEKWKKNFDEQTSRMLHYSWERGIRFFSIKPDQYYTFPLTELMKKEAEPFLGLSEIEKKALVGRLWEGLYKNYLLGIKKADGTIENPVGSTVPLILISKDKTRLLVLTESAKGEPILLRQLIEYGR